MTLRRLPHHIYTKIERLRARFYNLHPDISIGEGTCIERGAILRPISHWGRGKIVIGKGCYIGCNTQLIPSGKGTIVIGNNSTINPGCYIYGAGGIHIGNDVRIGPCCKIVAVNHVFKDLETPICKQGVTLVGITIEDDCWIGASATILDGVVVRSGNVIGAGSVVNRSTSNNTVYAGVPAKPIRDRG